VQRINRGEARIVAHAIEKRIDKLAQAVFAARRLERRVTGAVGFAGCGIDIETLLEFAAVTLAAMS
jgi:predicted nucleic acid-binding protein